MLAGSPSPQWGEVATVLEGLLTALSPTRAAMRALAEADPSGELADVVMCLARATWHLNECEIREARDTIAAAANAVARYLKAGG
jgi:hypothetical protein